MKLKKLAASLLAAAMLFCGTATTAFADGGCDGGWDDDLGDILEGIEIGIPGIDIDDIDDIDVVKKWDRGTAEGKIQLPDPDDVNVKVKYGKDKWVSVDVDWDDEDEDDLATVIPEGDASVTWKGEIDLEDIIKAIIKAIIADIKNNIISSGGKAIQANGGFVWGDDLKEELKTILQKVITELTQSGTNMFGEEITGTDANQWSLTSKRFKLLDDKLKPDPTLKLTNTYIGNNGDGGDEEEEDTVSITVDKVWRDEDGVAIKDTENLPAITVKLLADGEEVQDKTLPLSADNNWTGIFLELKKYQTDENGTVKVDEHNQPIVIEYTVKEEEVPGYEAEVTGNVKDGFTITNTYKGGDEEEPDKVYIRVEKEWKDEKGNEIEDTSDLPEVTVKLYADGNLYETEPIHLNKDNDWYGTFYNLPRYSNGKEINYTVREDVPNGYTVSYKCETNTDGNDVFVDVTITNTYTGDEEEENPVSFTKVFKLENGAKASDVAGHKFTFTLIPLIAELREAGEGNTIAPVTIEYSDKAVEVTFENVPEGIYTLEENMPEGWTNDMPEVVVSVREDGTVYFNNSTRLTVTNTYKKTDSTPIDSDDEEEEEKDESDLTVRKVDKETKALIKDQATFRIYKLSGSRKLYYTGSSWSSNVEKAKEYSTKNGKFTAYDLGAGTYYVEEVKAPSGYNLADDLKVKLTSKDKTVEFANSKAKQNPNTGALVLPLDLADAAVAAMTLGAAAWVISKSKK